MTAETGFKELRELLRTQVFSSSARVGILLALLGVRRVTFTDLLKATQLAKSSLYLHLKCLEDNGLIKVKDVLTPERPRTVIELTDQGSRAIERYLELLKDYSDALGLNGQKGAWSNTDPPGRK